MKALGLFSPRVLAAWLTIAILLFGATLYFMLFGQPDTPVGPSAFSRSAIGYAGIADVMHRLGARIVKSRSASLGKLDPNGVMIIAEPLPSTSPEQLRSLFTAGRALLVLPKWTGNASEQTPGWIKDASLLPEDLARRVARIAVPDADIVRVPSVTNWSPNEIGTIPSVTGDIQLVKSSRLRPVVATAAGMLVGELRTNQRWLWILADPDVMQNHGFPGNAAFATALINRLRGSDGNIVFDETVHGFTEQPRSPFWMLFEFPFVLATVEGAIAIAFLLWATMGRFGVPLTPPVAMASGKVGLIENTAKLFELARYQPVIIKRYVYTIIRDVARQLHAPSGMSDSTLVEWLRRTGRARAVEVDCGSVLSTANELASSGHGGGTTPLSTLARDIFRWKREIIDGVSRNPHPHRSDSKRGAQGGSRPG
jgi:hypothetical protein